jgi:hypothetical protein
MKMAIENYKVTTRLKNKAWTNLQTINHKKSHETDRTTYNKKTRTHVLKILNTINTTCG